jgi:hypothetical protein
VRQVLQVIQFSMEQLTQQHKALMVISTSTLLQIKSLDQKLQVYGQRV